MAISYWVYTVGAGVLVALLAVPAYKLVKVVWRNNVTEPLGEWIDHLFGQRLGPSLRPLHEDVVQTRKELREHMADEEEKMAKLDHIDQTLGDLAKEFREHVVWSERRSEELDEDIDDLEERAIRGKPAGRWGPTGSPPS